MSIPVKNLYMAISFTELQDRAHLDTKQFDGNDAAKVFNSTIKIYEEAEKNFKANDEEKAFFYYYRFIELVVYLKQRRDFEKNNEFGPKVNVAIARVMDLENRLNIRYEAIEELKKKSGIETSDLMKEENAKHLDDTKDVDPEPATIAKLIDCEPGCFISTTKLMELMYDPNSSFVLMDTRTSNQFEESHITHSNCINIPSEILTPGILAIHLENKLPKESLQMWKRRKFVDHVIMMDWDTETETLPQEHPLHTLEKAMCEWDLTGNLVKKPLILRKGYKDFMFSYPMFTTKQLYDLKESTSHEIEVPDVSVARPSSTLNSFHPSTSTSASTDLLQKYSPPTERDEKWRKLRLDTDKDNVGKKIAKAAAIGAGVGGAALIVVPLVIGALGFGAAGVAAGSAAAAFQSAFLGGTIVQGSLFAICQSVGAAGLATATQVGLVTGCAGAAAAIEGTVEAVKQKKKNT